MKTIAIPEDLHEELMKLKFELRDKNTAELVRGLVFEYKQRRFLESGRLFREKLREKNISFAELLKRSRKIREGIADEWYPD